MRYRLGLMAGLQGVFSMTTEAPDWQWASLMAMNPEILAQMDAPAWNDDTGGSVCEGKEGRGSDACAGIAPRCTGVCGCCAHERGVSLRSTPRYRLRWLCHQGMAPPSVGCGLSRTKDAQDGRVHVTQRLVSPVPGRPPGLSTSAFQKSVLGFAMLPRITDLHFEEVHF